MVHVTHGTGLPCRADVVIFCGTEHARFPRISCTGEPYNQRDRPAARRLWPPVTFAHARSLARNPHTHTRIRVRTYTRNRTRTHTRTRYGHLCVHARVQVCCCRYDSRELLRWHDSYPRARGMQPHHAVPLLLRWAHPTHAESDREILRTRRLVLGFHGQSHYPEDWGPAAPLTDLARHAGWALIFPAGARNTPARSQRMHACTPLCAAPRHATQRSVMQHTHQRNYVGHN